MTVLRAVGSVVLCVCAVSAQDSWETAGRNGAQAREAFVRCRDFVHGWLREATDPLSGLIPTNLTRSRDVWEPHNSAADNYAFMVLTSALVDPDLYRTRMLHMLDAETRLTSRLDSLPDTWRFSTRAFAHEQVDLRRVVFAASEYVKDGLMPIHELLGPTPWSERMLTLVDDLWKHAAVATPGGPIPAADAEVNGEMMQVTARVFWITGDQKHLDRACRIADHYLLEVGMHPSRDEESLRLRDHGCELISGLSEVYFACWHAREQKAAAYREPLHALLDRILEVGVNEHGMMYDAVNPKSGEVLRGSVSDTWGYTFNAFYTVWELDGVERYRDATRRALASLAPHYRGFAWEGKSADGYADSIEGAINLYAREVEFGDGVDLPAWIDSEIAVMFSKQQENGVVEGWHGDGNFARTALMYALWKQQGCHLDPWRDDVELGAVRVGDELRLTVTAKEAWSGRVRFDPPRHRTVMRMPADYPRINQFPEWFTVAGDRRHALRIGDREVALSGQELAAGFEVEVGAGETVRVVVTAAR